MNLPKKQYDSQVTGTSYQLANEQHNYSVNQVETMDQSIQVEGGHGFNFSVKGVLIGVAMILLLTIVSIQLILQYQINQLDQQISQYQDSIQELNLESDFLMSKILSQFDYEVIKQVAEDQGMTIDGSRVKDLTHE